MAIPVFQYNCYQAEVLDAFLPRIFPVIRESVPRIALRECVAMGLIDTSDAELSLTSDGLYAWEDAHWQHYDCECGVVPQ